MHTGAMCGFIGEYRLDAARADLDALCIAREAIRHRGPDGDGEFLSAQGRCAIAFCRLAVQDVSPAANMPMTDSDSGMTLALNGEIYNHLELRSRLGEGASFSTHSDSESLLEHFVANGGATADSLAKADGMFALALYNEKEESLTLARDRIGQKPLYYIANKEVVYFSSEIKALLAHPACSAIKADKKNITRYLATGYIENSTGRTAYESIRALPPATMIFLSPGRVFCEERYWEIPAAPAKLAPAGLREKVAGRLADIMPGYLLSDVPIGVFLSGGIDSAVVAAMAAKANRLAGDDSPRLRTFTASFDDPRYDESAQAQAVADHLGTDHTVLRIAPPSPEEIEQILLQYDQPFADSSCIPTAQLCRAASEHVTVALVGDGGDEVFCGYDRYRAMRLGETMTPPRYLLLRIAAMLAKGVAPRNERSRLRRLIRFADSLRHTPPEQYFRLRSLVAPEDLSRLIPADALEGEDAAWVVDEFLAQYDQGEFEDEPAYAQAHDIRSYLPDDLLVKTDIASMASSLELRAPLLDHKLVEMMLASPIEARLSKKARRGKVLLRELFAAELPKSVFSAPKRGFGVPLASWFRGPLQEFLADTITSQAFLDAGLVQPEAVAGMLNDHFSGRADLQHPLFATLSLAIWAKNHPEAIS